MSSEQRTPTQETYGDLQSAYDHFNTALFGGALPPCLITLHRKSRRVMGYFSPGRFSHRSEEGRTTDEIAMNPMYFLAKDDIEALQTLAHEMCHLWQQHFGKPSRSCYHNKEWADKMQAIGLMPTSTGGPGGKTTGQRMSDYPIAGGLFEAEAHKLIEAGFRLSWHDSDARLSTGTLTGSAGNAGEDNDGGGPETPADQEQSLSGKRVKFTCPDCGANAWGKPSLQIMCAPCSAVFESAG